VIAGFVTRRFDLHIRPLARPGGVLMRARAMVESTDTSQVISPIASARPCNRVRIRAHVPSRCQRRYSPYTERQCP
jgi:hypothetical protein